MLGFGGINNYKMEKRELCKVRDYFDMDGSFGDGDKYLLHVGQVGFET